MTNLWHDIDRKKAKQFNCIIEISKGSRIKYEVDKDSGLIMFDRALFSPFHYSFNYGFIPQTLWEDGDPIDVMILSHESIISGCLVECKPLGYLDMIDGGESDIKLIAVPVNDVRFEEYNDLEDIDSHLLKEIKHFFSVYKDLEGKKVELKNWHKKDKAIECIKKSFDIYDKKFKK